MKDYTCKMEAICSFLDGNGHKKRGCHGCDSPLNRTNTFV